MRRLAPFALLLVLSFPVAAGERCPRGIAVLSSSVGSDVTIEELEAFCGTCDIDLVVVDFAWITGLWGGTDLAKVEELAKRLGRRGIDVAAMYRPRGLRPSDADVHWARDREGNIAAGHNLLCFAHEDSVSWGLSWGAKILEGCPSIDRIVLYNLGAACACPKCADGGAAKHAAAFLAQARKRWSKIRRDVRIGHVSVGTEYAAEVDFLWPFLSVNRRDAGTPVDAAALVAKLPRPKGRPATPLAKICWASATENTTDDVIAALAAAEESGRGFVLWYYEWVFRPEDDRYDPEAIVRALGGDPDALRAYLHPPPKADPRAWVWFDARGSDDGPRLEAKGAKPAKAEADSVLISYLSGDAYGNLPRLSVTLGDTNRVLIRFPAGGLPRGRQVELRLRCHLSEIPPSAPFEIAVHAVTETWGEASATWDDPPAFEEEPAAVVTVEPEDGEVRIDLTKLVALWRSGRRPNQGILLKVANPVTGSPPDSAPGEDGADEDLLDRALALWPWAGDVETAKERATATDRHLLAVVSAEYRPEGRTAHEDLLLSTVLTHPDVLKIGRRAFVPVRVSYSPLAYTLPGSAGPDPLEALGSRVGDAKAPALLVATAEGETIAVLESIETFDHERVLAFLRDAIGERVEEIRTSEAEELYWRGARLWRDGKREEAQETLGEIAAGGSPWALKAAIRRAFPERLDLTEAIPGREAVDDPVRGGVRYLVETQSPDGSWPVAERKASAFRPGATVLAAHALLVHVDGLKGSERREARKALDRADAWLDENLANADPRTLNSFAAAYHLDYRLAARARSRAGKKDVAIAIRQLVGGELENGAWSYDRRFGETWRGGISGWPVTDRGRAHSVNTGAALLALADARDAGFDVPETAMREGLKALLSMKKGPAVFTYTWPEPRNFEKEDFSIARAPLCEQALLRMGRGSRDDLRKALDNFMTWRGDLETVRGLSDSWLAPRCYSSYFWFFAYVHAARALAELDDAAARRDLARIREDVLAIRETDGSWLDYRGVGKPYGTAMALLALDLAGAR